MLPPGQYRLVHDVADLAEPRLIEELVRAMERPLEEGREDEWVQGVVDVLEPALRELHLIGQAIGAIESQGLAAEVANTVLAKAAGDNVFFTDVLLAGRDAFTSYLRRSGVSLPEGVVKAFKQRREFASNYIAGRVSEALKPVLSNEVRAILSQWVQQEPLPDAPAFQELRAAAEQQQGQSSALVSALRRKVISALKGLTTQQRRSLRDQIERESMDVVEERLERLREGGDKDVGEALARIIERATDRSGRMKQWRAERIARTETMRALNSGMEQAWIRLAEAGEIDGDRAVKEWQITYDERTCRTCRPLDGKQRRLGSQFGPLRGGGWIMAPPVHPNCRCTLDLKFAEIGQVRKDF